MLLFEGGDGHRVVGLDGGAEVDQALGDRQEGGVPGVVGVWFKGDVQNADGGAPDDLEQGLEFILATSVMSAPTCSASPANSFIKEIFMARKALAAYLISSALVAVVVMNTGSLFVCGSRTPAGWAKVCSRIGVYSSRRTLAEKVLFAPTTIRSG